MLTRILLILTLTLMPAVAGAQKHQHKGGKQKDRTEWFKEMARYKADFVAGKLGLTDEQKAKFVPMYQQMEMETAKLAGQARDLERSVRQKGDAATDLEMEKAAEAQAELKARQGEIEKKYFEQYKSVLTPRQLLGLSKAEREFTRSLMDDHAKKKHGQKP